MELKDKKILAERFIKLGMGKYDSMIAAEFTQDEIDIMDKDESFTHRMEFLQKREISKLLQDVDDIINLNKGKGISTEIRWKLAKLDPVRFGEGIKLNGSSDKKKFVITFETVENTDDSNVEVNNGDDVEESE
jgi:hypothetical protein